ncbi:MAG: hypothetical protein HYY13_06375 [Nitrospirae bacterium]|nr:hypothetical protein [Nitrospirota bacterium]
MVGFLFLLLVGLQPQPAHAIQDPYVTPPGPSRSAKPRPLRLDDLGKGRNRSNGPVRTLSDRALNRTELAEAALQYLAAEDLRGPVALEPDYFAEIPLRTGQGDLVHVQFIQKTDDGLPLWGGRAHLTVRRDRRGTTVLAAAANLYPKLDLPRRSPQADRVLRARAAKILGLPPDRSPSLAEIRRFVALVGGRLRRLREMGSAKDGELHALVDEDATDPGAAWLFDPKVYIESQASIAESEPGPSYVFGDVRGKGYLFDPVSSAGFDRLPLKHLEVEATTPHGTFTTLTHLLGLFRFPQIQEPATVTATLTGSWVQVENAAGPTLSLSALGTPGIPLRLLFNESGANDEDTAQVDAYFHADFVHDWIQGRLPIPLSGLDIPIPATVNTAPTCNASYESSALDFRLEGKLPGYWLFPNQWCINPAYDTVIYHEYGHFADDMAGGMTESGLSEGWGDLIATFATGQPLSGENFFGEGTFVRTADNAYQFPWSGFDESHNLGQAWAGFAWHLRENLARTHGEPEGVALAEELLIPRLLSNSLDIPDAVIDVLLADDDNGDLTDLTPDFADIDAAARQHNLSPYFNTAVAFVGSPSGSNFISSEQSSVVIEGLADTSPAGIPFEQYQLFHGLGLAPAEFTPIGPPVATPVPSLGPLGTWELGGLPTGTYLVRALVTSTNGMQAQDLGLVGIELNRFTELSQTHPPTKANNFSGEGNRIVWVSREDNGDALFTCTYNPDTGLCENQLELPAGQPGTTKREPALSGDRLVWVEDDSGNLNVYLYDMVTGLEYPIATDAVLDEYQPTVSGTIVVWTEVNPLLDTGRPSVAACTFDPVAGTCPKKVIAENLPRPIFGYEPFPQVSGNYVVWSDRRGNSYDVYLYDLTTEVEHRLTTDTYGQIFPSIWGSFVVWLDFRGGDANTDIYGCRFDPTTGGCPNRGVVTQTSSQVMPHLRDGLLTWVDYRNASAEEIGQSNLDVYACLLDSIEMACPEQQITAHLAGVDWFHQNTGELVLWYDEREGGPFTYLAELP